MSESSIQPDRGKEAWESVLASLCHLQEVLPEAVLVGGTAAALYAKHRFSFDHDHVIPDLRQRFDTVLTELEAVAGWETARIKRPVVILGSLDGVETGAPFDRWSHIVDVCATLSDELLNACVQALQTEASPSAQTAQSKLDSWRDARAGGQTPPLSKLPGLKS